MFRKSYQDTTFTRELFEIVDTLQTNPPTYKLKDLKEGELIEGTFYEEELQRVCIPRMEILDVQWKHPFTCVVLGPSGSGKSTFVRHLMLSQEKIINAQFDYIYIFIGTDASENKILSCLLTDIPPSATDVKIIEIMNIFPTRKEMILEFPTRLKQMLISQNRKGRKGCVIFDYLMKELGEMGILLDLFMKMSSHYNTSVIHITQNLFHKGSGKHSSDHVGVYRNSHITVLFNNPLDNNPLWTIAGHG